MQKDRKAVWKAEDIGGMRENLRDQLLGLSRGRVACMEE